MVSRRVKYGLWTLLGAGITIGYFGCKHPSAPPTDIASVESSVAVVDSSTHIKPTPIQPLVHKDEFLAHYHNLQDLRFERFKTIMQAKDLESMLSTKRKQHSLASPAQRIIDNDYDIFQTNVSKLEQAQLIILGDVHGYMGDNLYSVLDDMVQKNDKILFERSSDDGPTDLRNLTREQKQKALKDYGSDFFKPVIYGSRGIIQPIDASEQVRFEALDIGFQHMFLRLANYQIVKKKKVHPFIQWLLYDDLKIAAREDNVIKVLSQVSNYLSELPKRKEIDIKRQKEIVNNVVVQVKNHTFKNYLILGGKHVTEYAEAPLLERLEQEGITYAAFLPEKTRLNLAFKRKFRKRKKSVQGLYDVDSDYVVNNLIDGFISGRVEKGAPKYAGTLDGLADELTECLGQGK